MPNRVQTLRSSVPGSMPQAATRSPGELWLNFADAHLGYIDASQTAQKLLAVRLFVSTAAYATGDFAVYAGNLYQAIAPSAAGAFTAANWTKIGTAQDLAQYLPLAGGTLTGALNLPAAAPTVATQAANKSYVDAGDATVLAAANTKLPLAGGTLTGALNGTTANFSGVATAADPPALDSSSKLVTTAWYASHQPVTKDNSNRIINGDMRIDQRNNGATGNATGAFVADRWIYAATQPGKGNWQRNTGPGPAAIGFPYCLSFFSSSAYTSLVTDTFYFSQGVEADMIADFMWGTPNAQPATLSFWVNVGGGLSGTFSGALCMGPAPPTRSYPFSFFATSGWQKVVVPIAADTSGAWITSGNGAGVFLRFDLGCGANYRSSAGAWQNGNIVGVNGALSVVAINGGVFQVTGVKLEVGGVATQFTRQSTAKSIEDCQRYYQTGQFFYNLSGQAAGANLTMSQSIPVQTRAAPTMTTTNNSSSNFTLATLGFNSACLWAAGTVPAAGVSIINIQYAASADF
jgi:hypothetical protein